LYLLIWSKSSHAFSYLFYSNYIMVDDWFIPFLQQAQAPISSNLYSRTITRVSHAQNNNIIPVISWNSLIDQYMPCKQVKTLSNMTQKIPLTSSPLFHIPCIACSSPICLRLTCTYNSSTQIPNVFDQSYFIWVHVDPLVLLCTYQLTKWTYWFSFVHHILPLR